MAREKKEIKEMERMRKMGKTYQEIGEKFGITRQTAYTILNKNKPAKNPQEKESKLSHLIDIFVEEYKKGYPLTDIARKYNTTHQAVNKILKKQNVIIPGKRNRKPASEVPT